MYFYHPLPPSIRKGPSPSPKPLWIQSLDIQDWTPSERRGLFHRENEEQREGEKRKTTEEKGEESEAEGACPGNNKNRRWWIDSIRYRRKRRSVRQQIIITIIFQKSGQQTIGPVIENGRVSISPRSVDHPLSLFLSLSLSLARARVLVGFPHRRRGSKAWYEGLRSCNPGESQHNGQRGPWNSNASGCVRCDPVSLVTLMQPEIYCRWLCADGSTRRRRWGLALGCSPGSRYRTAAIDWRGHAVLDISSIDGNTALSPVISFSLYASLSLSLSLYLSIYLSLSDARPFPAPDFIWPARETAMEYDFISISLAPTR